MKHFYTVVKGKLLLAAFTLFQFSFHLTAQCVVSNTNSRGAGSLYEVVMNTCPDGGTVTFDPTTFNTPGDYVIGIGEAGSDDDGLSLGRQVHIEGPDPSTGVYIVIDGSDLGENTFALPTELMANVISMGDFEYQTVWNPTLCPTGPCSSDGSSISNVTIINAPEHTDPLVDGASNALNIGQFGSNISIDNVNFGVSPSGNSVGVNNGHNIYVANVSNIDIINSVVSNSAKNGIQLQDVTTATISGNYIGLDHTGTSCLGNQWDGVHLVRTSEVTIGGDNTADRNYIGCNGVNEDPESNNGKRGIYFQDSDDNIIKNNYVGLGVNGDETDLGNYHSGIEFSSDVFSGGDGSDNNEILGNVISGNGRNAVTTIPNSPTNSQHGIVITKSGDNNLISMNLIGMTADGTDTVGNLRNGIEVGASDGNQIGGSTVDSANTIVANGNIGVIMQHGANDNVIQNNFIGVDENGTPYGNAEHGIQLSTFADEFGVSSPISNNQILDNTISANGITGIQALGPESIDDIIIQGNKIGVAPDGTVQANLGNGLDGILIQTDLTGILIGGSGTGEGNVISNNGQHAINLDASNSSGSNNQILGNLIGVEGDGVTAAANGGSGVNLDGNTQGVQIGGSSAAERNIISGNTENGIFLGGFGVNTIDIYQNYIGLDENGDQLANGVNGIQIDSGSTINIGGTGANQGSWISGNTENGILVTYGDGININSNIVGLNVAGSDSIANGSHGINVVGGDNIAIGSPGFGNVVSGNRGNGINIENSTATSITLQSNYVGTDITGEFEMSNKGDGILIQNTTGLNTIGGTGAGEGNLVSGNLGHGISLVSSSAATAIVGNIIGLNKDALTEIGNLGNGIDIVTSSNVTVGGTVAGSTNIISGNGDAGDVDSGNGVNFWNSSSSVVQGNIIGLSGDESTDIGNIRNGVNINGGTTTATSSISVSNNVIAGNDERGVMVGTSSNVTLAGNILGTTTDFTGDFPPSFEDVLITNDATSVTVGGAFGTVSSNVFGGTSPTNIRVNSNANEVNITGNYIGVNSTETTARTATTNAIVVEGTTDEVTIGGLGSLGNTIFLDNATSSAVLIQGNADNTAVLGNDFGSSSASQGTNDLGITMGTAVQVDANATNSQIGTELAGNIIGKTALTAIYLNGTGVTGTDIESNFIGTTGPGEDDPALSIGGSGIFVNGSLNTSITGNYVNNVQDNNSAIQITGVTSGTTNVDGNFIGIDNNESSTGNTGNGLTITNSSSTINIGVTNPNIISGNAQNGIEFNNSTAGLIVDNFIGTDFSGATAVANGMNGIALVNGSSGIQITDNLVSGNTEAGILLDNTTGNSITGNFVGTQADLTSALGNGTNGLTIVNGGANNTISSNTFANNTENGVSIDNGTGTSDENTMSQNSMFCNGARGIEENDNGNSDFMNPLPRPGIDPTTNLLLLDPGTLPVTGIVEVFQKGTCAGCGDYTAQGATYIGSYTVVADGALSFDLTPFVGGTVSPTDSNDFIFTITDPSTGNTSEFSDCSTWLISCEDPVAVVTPGPTTAICDGDSLELKATYNLDHLYTWYEATAPTTPINGAGAIANDSILYVSTAGDYLVLIEHVDGCDSLSESVNVTVTTPPTVSDAGEDDTLCNQTFYSLSANHDAVGSGIWEMVTGTGTFVNIVSETAGVTDMVAPDTLTLVWTISEATNVCPPSRDTVIIINDAQPAADAGANDTICEDAFPYTLTASDPTTSISSSNGVWTLEAGTGTINDDQAHNTTVDDITVGGESTFRWTVTNGECSDFDEVIVVSDAIPTTADAGENDTICNTPTYTLAGNTITIGNGMWNVVSGTGTVTTPTSPISGVAGMSAPGELVLEWEATSEFGKCAANSTQVVIVNDEMPIANAGGTDQICVSSLPYTLSANNPTVGTGSWEVTSGTGTLEDATLFDSEIDAITAGTTPTITWTVVNGVCTATDDFDLTVDDAPSPAVAGTDANPCTPTTDLAATLPTTGTGTWMSLQGSATIDDPSSPTSELTGLIEGQLNELEWCVSLAGSICADTCDVVEITRLSNPITEVVLSEDSPVCEGDDITFTTVVTNGGTAPTYEWLVNDASQGAASTTANTFVTSTLSSGDDISVIVTGNDACVTDNIDTSNVVSPTIETTPEGDASGPTAVVCGDATTDLTGTVTSITGNGTWSVSSTSLATATINSTSGAITNISPVGTDLTVLYTVSNGTGAECPDDVNTVVVSSTPILTPDISITGDTEQCEGDDITVSIDTQTDLGTTPTFNWYVNGELVTTSGTSLTTDTLSQTSSISVAAISSETCVTSPSDSVAQSVDIVNVPTVAISGADFCPNETTTLTATPGASTYEWTLNPSTTLSETSESYTTGTEGTYSVIAINNGATVSCPSTPDQLGISEVEIVVDAGDDQEFKLEYDVASVTTTINGTSTINNNPVWTNSSGAVIDNPNTLSTAVTVEPGTYVFTLTDNNGTCSDSDQMTIKVTGKIKIHNAFSPPGNGNGGDGSNDEWVILGLDGFDKYTIKVFNRYGNLIREWEDVYTPWDGKSKAGDEFPVGTYWYVVDVPGDGQYAGSLTLMR